VQKTPYQAAEGSDERGKVKDNRQQREVQIELYEEMMEMGVEVTVIFLASLIGFSREYNELEARAVEPGK
jgi:hypothetical protein